MFAATDAAPGARRSLSPARGTDTTGMIHYAVTATKRRIIDDFLALQARRLEPRVRVVTYRELTHATELPRGAWILSDVDGLGPSTTRVARAVAGAVEAAGLPLLNHPDRALNRLDLLRRLHRAGINTFRAVPVSGDLEGLRYPVFVRGGSDHLGPVSDLLDGPVAVREVVGRVSRAGVDAEELIAVEYVDVREEDGLVTKFGTYRVGDRIVPQHLLRSESWMIKHRGSRFTVAIAERERRFVEENPHAERLRDVFELAGIDFGRADYAVDREGRLQVWEINTCPMFARSRRSLERPSSGGAYEISAEARAIRRETKARALPALIEAMAALDVDTSTAPPLGLEIAEEDRDAAAAELGPREGGAAFLALLRARTHFGNRW